MPVGLTTRMRRRASRTFESIVGRRSLLDELATRLLARARLHAQAGRFREAVLDLDKVEAIDRTGPDATELRGRVLAQLREHRAERDEARAALDAASRKLEAGRLDSVRAAIDKVDDASQRDALRDELDARVQRSSEIVAQAGAALDRDDPLAAARLWHEAVSRHGRSQETDALAMRLVPAVRRVLNDLFQRGRLDQFEAALDGVRPLAEFDPSLDEFDRIAALCSQAASHLAVANCSTLRQTLLRLRASRQDVGWLEEALNAVSAMEAAQGQLLSSPVAIFNPTDALPQAPAVDPEPLGPGQSSVPADERHLLLLVDGTGSCLLTRRQRLRIGRAGADDIDIPIPADIQSHHADILVEGDEYFLVSFGPTRVNGATVKRTLLRDGDRVKLGGSKLGGTGKFVFKKPSAKSDSAVLLMSDRCRLPQDVSRVVLFRDTCLLGPQPSAHIQTREGESRLVLFTRHGQLAARQDARVGGRGAQAQAVPLDETKEFGDVRITVKNYAQIRKTDRRA